MLYSEREHPLKTIWCLLINKNSVFGVLRQEKRRKAHVGLASWVKTRRVHPRALLRSRFCIALVCQHFAPSSSDIWQDSIRLRWGWVAEDAGSEPFTCSLVLPCRYVDSLGSLLAGEFSGRLILDAHICFEVPFLGRQALRSYLKLCFWFMWVGTWTLLFLLQRTEKLDTDKTKSWA